jgi:hypothetical protein
LSRRSLSNGGPTTSPGGCRDRQKAENASAREERVPTQRRCTRIHGSGGGASEGNTRDGGSRKREFSGRRGRSKFRSGGRGGGRSSGSRSGGRGGGSGGSSHYGRQRGESDGSVDVLAVADGDVILCGLCSSSATEILICDECTDVCDNCLPNITSNTTILNVRLPTQVQTEPGRDTEDHSRTLEVEALLDTGANRHNFISESLARELAAQGVQYEPCHFTLHFAQRGTSVIVNNKMSVNTSFLNRLTKAYEPLALRDALVVPVLRYDIIVGLPTIKSEGLISKLTDWCVSADCISDQCSLRPGNGRILRSQARTVDHPQRCGSSWRARKSPVGGGCAQAPTASGRP